MAGLATAAIFTGALVPPAAAAEAALTSSPNGGWPGQTGAMHQQGVTVFGWVDPSGNIEAAQYDHATATVSSIATLHAALEADHHNDPELFIRADGYVVAVYCAHNGANLYRRVSSSVRDVSAWGAEGDIDGDVGGSTYTYPRIIQLVDEASDPLYLFIRDGNATNADLIMSKSTDGGVNWSAKTILWDTPSKGHYFRVASNGTDRFDIVVSDGTAEVDDADLYHFYYQGGDWFDSAGTDIGDPPFTTSEATLVYDGSSEGVRLPFDLAYLDGQPVTVISTWSGDDFTYRYARWTGSSWLGSVITTSGGTLASYEGGMALLSSAPSFVYLSRVTGGTGHLFRYRTLDGGATWSSEQITTDGGDHIYPVSPRGAASDLRVIWLEGTYVADPYSYSWGINGGW